MLWACVVVLALLLTLVTAALVTFTVKERQQFRRLPGAFRCRLRLVRGVRPGVTYRWRGRPVWASWAHDVLLVRLGRLPATTRVLLVRFPEGSIAPVSAEAVKGLGRDPVLLRMRLDDGDVVEVATTATARERLAGPFLAACLTGGERTDGRPPGR